MGCSVGDINKKRLIFAFVLTYVTDSMVVDSIGVIVRPAFWLIHFIGNRRNLCVFSG